MTLEDQEPLTVLTLGMQMAEGEGRGKAGSVEVAQAEDRVLPV